MKMIGLLLLCLLVASCSQQPVVLKYQAGQGEFSNRVKVVRQAYRVDVPLVDMSNELRFAAVAEVQRAESEEETLRYTDPFAGISLMSDSWHTSLTANDKNYRVEVAGEVPLLTTMPLYLIGGVTHQNAHTLDAGERRFKKTEAFAGIEYAVNCRHRVNMEYRAGNHGSDEVWDVLLFGWKYFFGCP